MAFEAEQNRKLRVKERKVYVDDIDDEEIEGGNKRLFSVEEKLKSTKFQDADFLQEMNGEDLTCKYFQENGLKNPILVKEKTGLGLRIPGENFTVTDVRQCVGSRRVLDVMDVNTQKGIEMTMKEWVSYYEKPEKDRLLNVISLEFSHTRLENYVDQPQVVRQFDWVDTVWPSYLKEIQSETTNVLENMKYPKVQKYCLMSVGGCYTDFHIDMGGTSVWYHILKGSKVFWLIPPTEENLNNYEQWTKSGRQGDSFFGDKVKKCARIHLEKGNTFFIPTGWIHAVYTPEDSLVFGGNFLHSLNIEMQLRIWEIESRTHVPSKFRYPFFTEIHWYVLDRYLTCVGRKSYRVKAAEEIKADKEEDELDEDEKNNISSSNFRSTKGRRVSDQDLIRPVSVKLQNCMNMDKKKLIEANRKPLVISEKEKPWVHLTQFELRGLSVLVEWLKQLPPTKKLVPKDITDPNGLLADVRQMLEEHGADSTEDACTGISIIKWPTRKTVKPKVRGYTSCFPRSKTPKAQKNSVNNPNRRRRVRCKICEPCTRTDCRLCSFCNDMKKYGGPGRMKQSCISRQCIRPALPASASCLICNLGSRASAEEISEENNNNVIMECGICWDIVHPSCHRKKYTDITTEGCINDDLPNSWECPKCVDNGKHGQLKPRTRPTCKSVNSVEPAPTCSPAPSLQDSDVENHKLSPSVSDTSDEQQKPIKEVLEHRSPLNQSTTPVRPKSIAVEPQKTRRRSRSVDVEATPPRKVLRVELSPLRDSPSGQHYSSKYSSNTRRRSLSQVEAVKSSLKTPQSPKTPNGLPSTRVTSRGREINLPSRFLR